MIYIFAIDEPTSTLVSRKEPSIWDDWPNPAVVEAKVSKCLNIFPAS